MKILKLSFLLLALTLGCKEKTSTNSSSSTSSENVLILEPIKMNLLNRSRIIRLYLPPGYNNSAAAYPVIYAHDGQNLFDDSTSYVGEWGLDESLNQIAGETGWKAIIVGLDNGQDKRINELSPWPNDDYGAAEGNEYLSFIINQVKPLIDSTYRTLPGREHTAIMGSSLGGFISHYAIYRYPEVFSKAIIFSPSYWYAEEVWDFTSQNPLPKDSRLWLEIGQQEGNAVEHTNNMYTIILNSGHPEKNIVKKVDPEGEHNEQSWRRQFVPAVKWLFEID